MNKGFLEITRLDEIRSFMKSSADVLNLRSSWVAVDDQAKHFPATELLPFDVNRKSGIGTPTKCDEVVVLVDGVTGLTAQSAAVLDAAIVHASSCKNRVGQPCVAAATGISVHKNHLPNIGEELAHHA